MSNIISFLKAKVSKFFSCLTSCLTSRPDGSSSSLRPAEPPAQPECKVDPSHIEEGKGDLSEKGGSSSLRPAEPPVQPECKVDPSPIEEGKGDLSGKGLSLRAPLEGDGSSSSSVSKPSDLVTSIMEAAGTAIDGKEGNLNLDELINYISELLEVLEQKSSKEKLKFPTYKFWSRITSKDLLNLKEFFTGVKEFASAVKDIIPSQGASAAKTVVVDLLNGIGHASLATAGLLVVATILERFENVSDIKVECLSLLGEMNSLAKHVKELQKEPWLNEQMEGPIRKATELILEASILCCTQIDSSRFSRFFLTSENKKDLLTYREELRKMYRVMDNRMSVCLFRANRPRRQKPVHIEYPTNAVGIEDPLDKVIELLDWRSEKNAIAVVIHGFGGMGKTTLANAVYATLFDQNNIKGCKYAMVRLFENIATTPNVMKLQKDIIKDLSTGRKEDEDEDAMPDIRTFEQGQHEIGLLLKEEVAFIFIDNVLLQQKVEQGRDALEQLLPQNMRIAKKLRFLITARDRNAVRMREEQGIQTKFYAIETLVDEKAMELVKQKLGDKEKELHSSQMKDIVEACGGIPKLLTVVAGFISSEENAKDAYRTVMDEREKNWKGEIGENIRCYVFAYENLENSLRDPFLDICSFFQGWNWEALSNIVGEQELKKLEKRALVTQDVKSMTARVHDIILKIGLQESEGERFRFTSASEIREFFEQKEDEDLRKIKGIWSSKNKDPLHLPASKLDLMCKSLRVLTFGHLTYVEGKCQRIFVKLVFFSAEVCDLPFDVSKLKDFKELRHLCFKHADLQNLSQMPSNLRHIDLQLNSPDFQISSHCIQQLSNLRVLKLENAQLKKLPHELGDVVNGLRELQLIFCEQLEELPGSVSKLRSLRVLKLFGCCGLRQLPTDLGSFNDNLQVLDLSLCIRLEALPSSLENLTSLKRLGLGRCESLKALPSNLGKLISLQIFHLVNSKSLEALPTSLEELSSLRLLDLSKCESLKGLPDGIGKLTALVILRLRDCTKLSSIPDSIGDLKLESIDLTRANLKELPDGFCNLSVITELTMSNCSLLEKLPDRFGKATSLIKLSLFGCRNLKKLPESFSQLKCLEELDLSWCTSLEELCTDFKCLSSLQVLSLYQCKVLKKLPENFGQLKCLERLDLSCCTSLEDLCADFKCLSSLQVLSLHSCKVLKELPDDFHLLTSLHTLRLTDCDMLEGKWMESMVKMKTLQILGIRESTLLEERWEEIQRQGDQSWSCAVHARQGLSNKENFLKQVQSEFDCLLINGQGEPVHISDLPLNTLLLVLFDSIYRRHDISSLQIIEQSIDDIQANFVVVYFGKHHNLYPQKVAHKIVGHAPADAKAQAWFQKLFVAAEQGNSSRQFLTDRFDLTAKVVRDEKGFKYLSCWEVLSGASAVEEFVVKKCGKYPKLKQLVESPRENHIELLRELFASGEEESSLGFLKNGALTQVGLKELEGKKILLDIRLARISYDITLPSLVEMYVAEKDRFNFEIITIPIIEYGRQLDACKKFSRDVPWLVIQDPWQLMNATMYFLVEGSPMLFEEPTWHPNIMRIIESNGTMAAHNPGAGGLLRMVNVWGIEAYPFTEEKYSELMEKEVREKKSMPNVLFLFKHLERVSEQVKRAIREQKMICLYTSDNREFTNSINNVLMEWSDSIYIIYIPQFQFQNQFAWFTLAIDRDYLSVESSKMVQAEMQGMSLLNLSEHEVMRFWERIFLFIEAAPKIDDKDEELNKIDSLLNFIYARLQAPSWMVIMDEDGNLITEKGKEIVELLCEEDQNGEAKELIKGTEESLKEILVKSVVKLEQRFVDNDDDVVIDDVVADDDVVTDDAVTDAVTDADDAAAVAAATATDDAAACSYYRIIHLTGRGSGSFL